MAKERVDYRFLEGLARGVRRDILETIFTAGSGHPGGSLSCVEILLGLYFHKMRIDPRKPDRKDRDIFILSKGHCSPALYTVLAYKGFFPKEELKTFRKLNSRLQGHAYKGVPGVEASTGSLGQGLSIANGIAIAAKYDRKDIMVYCLIGDGEMEEGQIWEAVTSASFRGLDNLCAIIDRNGIQQDGRTSDIKDLEPVREKWETAGWHAIEIDGHNIREVIKALDKACKVKKRPTVIIAHTVKGKGVSFMENDPAWHGKAPNRSELDRALKELEG